MAHPRALDKIVASAAAQANVRIAKEDLRRIQTCQPHSPLAQWIEESLRGKRFLTSEELKLSRLDGNSDKGFAIGEGRRPGVPLREEELLDEIVNLDAETQVLTAQTRALEAQGGLLDARNGNEAMLERGFAEKSEERYLDGIRAAKRGIHDVQREIEEHLRAAEELVDKATKGLPAIVTELLSTHDRLLAGIARAEAAELAIGQPKRKFDTVEQLTAILTRMMAEELQIRLDRTYLESLKDQANFASSLDGSNPDNAENLEQDLQTLYSEIPDVAMMYVEQKYREPLVFAIREEGVKQKAIHTARSSAATGAISAMISQLELLAGKARLFHSYRSAIQKLRLGYEQLTASEKREGSSPTKVKLLDNPPSLALDKTLQHFGVSPTLSLGLPELVNDKLAKLQHSTQGAAARIGVDARVTFEERKTLVDSVLQGVDQHDDHGLLKLNQLDAKISVLREEVEALNAVDTRQAMQKQRNFTERWS